jgi:hypothetical protein
MDVSRLGEKACEVLRRVERDAAPVILECSGREIGAFVPMHMYQAMMADRDALFEEIERGGDRMPDYTEEELEPIIARAVAEARGKGAKSRL